MTHFSEETPQFQAPQRLVLPRAQIAENIWKEVVSSPLSGGTLANPEERPLLPETYRNELARLFSPQVPEIFMNAWHQALINSAMPVEFAARHTYERFSFEIDGQSFSAVKVGGVDHNYRRNTISSTPQHIPRHPADWYGPAFAADCMLDMNIMQALDARHKEPGVKNNALADLGKFIWLVNKFPWGVGDTLILPKDHDDQSGRAVLSSENRTWTKNRPSDTRGAIISYDFMATVIGICDRFDQVAHRNHAMDGMSVPLHDHFKLLPAGHPVVSIIPSLMRPVELEGSRVMAYRADNSPFETLCLTSLDHNQLAHSAAELLEALERSDQIFTVMYSKGTVFITLRNSALYGDGNPDGWTGSSVGYHGIEDPATSPHYDRVLKYILRNGEFNWASLLGRLLIEVHESAR